MHLRFLNNNQKNYKEVVGTSYEEGDNDDDDDDDDDDEWSDDSEWSEDEQITTVCFIYVHIGWSLDSLKIQKFLEPTSNLMK